MSAPEADKPVFPIKDMNNHPGPLGITLRSYAAIHIMAGLVSDPSIDAGAERIAQFAVALADSLLEELAK